MMLVMLILLTGVINKTLSAMLKILHQCLRNFKNNIVTFLAGFLYLVVTCAVYRRCQLVYMLCLIKSVLQVKLYVEIIPCLYTTGQYKYNISNTFTLWYLLHTVGVPLKKKKTRFAILHTVTVRKIRTNAVSTHPHFTNLTVFVDSCL